MGGGGGREGWWLPDLHVPRYLLNAQEPDILPYDLLWGELEGKDSGGALSPPKGWEWGRVGGESRHLWNTEPHRT